MRLWPSTSDGAAILGACISALGGLFALAFIGTFALFAPLLLFPPVTSVKTALLEVAIATAALYLVSNALKLLSKRRPGYHEDAAGPLATTRLGQPVLLATSFALGIVLVAYPAWWHQRLASREYAHAKGCYAQLRTAERLPELQASFAPGYLRYHAESYLGVAEDHGAMLGAGKDAVDRDLSEAAAAYSNSYSAAAAVQKKVSALLNDVTQCLNDDWARHGEILNP